MALTLAIRLTADATGFVGTVDLADKELEALGTSADRAGRETRQAAAGMDRMERSARSARDPVGDLKTALAGIIGLHAVREVIEIADGWTALSSRIRVAAGSADLAAAVQERLFEISQDTEQSFSATVQLYVRLVAAGRELGASQAQILDSIEAVNLAMRIAGAQGAAAAGALIQLSQAMGSGTLRGDELNSVLDQSQTLSDLLAAELGVSTTKLRQMGEAGRITGDVMLRALLNSLQRLRDESALIPPLVLGQLGNLRDGFQKAFGEISESLGAGTGLAELIRVLTRNIDLLVAALGGLATAAIIAGLTRLISLFRALFAVVLAHPFVAFAAAIGAAATLAIQHWEPVAAFFGALWDVIREGAIVVGQGIVHAFEDAGADTLQVMLEMSNDVLRVIRDMLQAINSLPRFAGGGLLDGAIAGIGGQIVENTRAIGRNRAAVTPPPDLAPLTDAWNRLGDALTAAGDAASQTFDDILGEGGGTIPAMAAIGDGADQATSALRRLIDGLDEAGARAVLEVSIAGLDPAGQAAELALFDARIAAREDFNDGLRQTADLSVIEEARIIAAARSTQEAEAALEAFTDRHREAKSVFEEFRDPLDIHAARIAELVDLMPLLTDLTGDAAQAQEIFNRAVADADADLARATKGGDALKDALGAAAEAGGGLLRALRDGADGALDVLDKLVDRVFDIAIINPFESALNTVFNGTGGEGGLLSGFGDFVAGLFHTGGTVGQPGPGRAVPAAVFAGARRAHSGAVLGPSEVPVIAKRGETIFTPEQLTNAQGLVSALSAMAARRDSGTVVNIIDQRGAGGDVDVQERTGTDGQRQVDVFVKDSVTRGIASGRYDRVLGARFGLRPQATG